MLKRRELITRMLVGTGVALSAPIIEASSAVASPLETHDFDQGLAEVTRRIYRIGADHMKFQTDRDKLLAEAAAAWRDAMAYRAVTTSRSQRRASDAVAYSAGLVAQFYGDRGNLEQAQAWYSKAYAAAMEHHAKSWLASCQMWIPLYAGNTEVAVRIAKHGRGFQSFRDPERLVFGQMQAARAYASNGDLTDAMRAFDEAERAFSKEECNLHRESEPNLLHFTQWQFYQYAAEIMGSVGKFNRSRQYHELALRAPNLNGMNKAVMALSESSILLAEGDAQTAVTYAISVVSGLKKSDATSSVVRGRVTSLTSELRKSYGNIAPVHQMEDFQAALVAAA